MTSSGAAASAGISPSGAVLEEFSYDDVIVRKFLFATVLWGIVGMLVGLLIALQPTSRARRKAELKQRPRATRG